jgi:hypothetical protein
MLYPKTQYHMRLLKIIYCLLPLLGLILTACTPDDNSNASTSQADAVSEFLLHANGLKITLLTDDEDNETELFRDYLFVFRTDNTVVATAPNGSRSGTYSVFRDDGRIELQMDFSSSDYFDELDDDWYFIAISSNRIRFDDSGDVLEFQQQ